MNFNYNMKIVAGIHFKCIMICNQKLKVYKIEIYHILNNKIVMRLYNVYIMLLDSD